MKKDEAVSLQILSAIQGLEKGQKQLQKEVKGLLVGLYAEVRKQGMAQKEMETKLSLIIEAVAPEFEKQTHLEGRVEAHGNTLVLHDLRLHKLES